MNIKEAREWRGAPPEKKPRRNARAQMTPEAAHKWRIAFLHLQARPPRTEPLVALLKSGEDIPAAIAHTLAGFIEDPDGKGGPTLLRPAKNTKWHGRQRSADNRLSKTRLGQKILRDIEAGLTTKRAIQKHVKAGSFCRSYLFECLEEAKASASRAALVRQLTQGMRVHDNSKNDVDQ